MMDKRLFMAYSYEKYTLKSEMFIVLTLIALMNYAKKKKISF